MITILWLIIVYKCSNECRSFIVVQTRCLRWKKFELFILVLNSDLIWGFQLLTIGSTYKGLCILLVRWNLKLTSARLWFFYSHRAIAATVCISACSFRFSTVVYINSLMLFSNTSLLDFLVAPESLVPHPLSDVVLLRDELSLGMVDISRAVMQN